MTALGNASPGWAERRAAELAVLVGERGDPMLFVGRGEYRLASRCSPGDLERAHATGSQHNADALGTPPADFQGALL